MKQFNKEVVPDFGANLKFKDGVCIAAEAEKSVILYLGHEQETVTGEDGQDMAITRALAIEVEKPVTRAKAINAFERTVFNLETVEHMASFNAALARKARNSEDLEEVLEHDEAISWCKTELTRIGITR